MDEYGISTTTLQPGTVVTVREPTSLTETKNVVAVESKSMFGPVLIFIILIFIIMIIILICLWVGSKKAINDAGEQVNVLSSHLNNIQSQISSVLPVVQAEAVATRDAITNIRNKSTELSVKIEQIIERINTFYNFTETHLERLKAYICDRVPSLCDNNLESEINGEDMELIERLIRKYIRDMNNDTSDSDSDCHRRRSYRRSCRRSNRRSNRRSCGSCC